MTSRPVFDPRLNAILAPAQLGAFCARFSLKPSDLEPVSSGWTKNVVLSRDHAFVFPRDPRRVVQFERELAVYRYLSRFPQVPSPRMIELVRDEEICYFPFLVVTRVRGVPFSTLWPASDAQLDALFSRLGAAVAVWHALPTRAASRLPPLVYARSEPAATTAYYPWLRAACSPATSEEAVAFAHERVLELGRVPASVRQARDTWTDVVAEIARLSDVFVHGDVHDEQIFVEPARGMRVTAMIDWEGARVGPPVVDFDLFEWGAEIWASADRFLELRARAWRSYRLARGLRLSTDHGLHLLFTLTELMGLLGGQQIGFARARHLATPRAYVRRLEQVTELL